MTTPRKATVVAILAALALTLGACSRPRSYINWNAPTTFRFKGLTDSQAPAVEQIFRDHRVSYRRSDDSPIEYQIDGITKVRDLAFLLQDLRRATRAASIDAPFENATLEFGGIAAYGDVTTSIKVTVSPGAAAWIADGPQGARWRPIPVSSRGTWQGNVRTDGLVAREGGWVYIAAQRGGIFRYYRVNVLSKDQERISYADVRAIGLSEPTEIRQPEDKPRAEEDESDGDDFKWPWEK